MLMIPLLKRFEYESGFMSNEAYMGNDEWIRICLARFLKERTMIPIRHYIFTIIITLIIAYASIVGIEKICDACVAHEQIQYTYYTERDLRNEARIGEIVRIEQPWTVTFDDCNE